MENSNLSAFEGALQAIKSKAAGTLKTHDIKRLIKLLGKRPSEIGARQITELIGNTPDNDVLVYELLCEIELAKNPNTALAILRTGLIQIAASWTGNPPPATQQPEALDWLRAEAMEIMSSKPPNVRRFRGVTLWILGQYRNPDFFLTCLVELALHLRKRSSASQPAFIDRGASGFVMARIARALATWGRGRQPKLAKLHELGVAIESVLSHLDEKLSNANAAIGKLETTEQSLATQKALTQQQAETIQTLEASIKGLETQMKKLNDDLDRLKSLHQQALGHAESQIEEARKTTFSNLKSKIQPKLSDAQLYANRPAPAVDQVLRLIAEIEQALNSQEGKA